MNLSIDELRSFAAAAETGSFSAAARKLRRAQSVVSVHIAGLEAELGCRLFDRTPKPVLTARGKELLPAAKRVIAEADRLQMRACALAANETPSLYMGIDSALEAPVMIDWLRLFAQQFPAVRLQVENITGSEAQWFFAKAGMNLALVFDSGPTLESNERVLGRSPVVIVAAKTHPLAAIARPSVEDLRRHRQIVVYASAPESASVQAVSTDHWEVDSGLWALGLAAKGIGLIERIRQGQGRPAKIYVKQFTSPDLPKQPEVSSPPAATDPRLPNFGSQDFGISEVLTSEKQTSRLPEIGSADFRKSDGNYNNIIYPYGSYLDPSIHPSQGIPIRPMDRRECREEVKDNIEYNQLRERYGLDEVNEILDLITDTLCSTRATIRIGGEERPIDAVKDRFWRLEQSHIEYVLERMKENTTKIRNIRGYLLTALYNAPATIGHYYQAEVQHDLYGQ